MQEIAKYVNNSQKSFAVP